MTQDDSASTSTPDSAAWLQVGTAATQVEAEMIRNLLMEDGIGCMIRTNDASAYLGAMSRCALLVRAVDREQALAFLAEWEDAEMVVHPESEEMP